MSMCACTCAHVHAQLKPKFQICEGEKRSNRKSEVGIRCKIQRRHTECCAVSQIANAQTCIHINAVLVISHQKGNLQISTKYGIIIISKDGLFPYCPACQLICVSQVLLPVPSLQRWDGWILREGFFSSGTSLWNVLPLEACLEPTLLFFRPLAKTFLLTQVLIKGLLEKNNDYILLS